VVSVALSIASCTATQGTVTGVVVDVTGDLTSVTSFTVHTEEGEDLVLVPDPLGSFDFPLVHLRAHLSSLEPVQVTYLRADDGTLIATAISDA
jgi:hypothetical protein